MQQKTLKTVQSVEAALKSFHWFEECMILKYWSENLNRDFSILINNIRDMDGNMRLDLGSVRPVIIEFRYCQEIIICNNFDSGILDNWSKVNWGINEFSTINVEEGSHDCMAINILWENERHVRIICKEVVINNEMRGLGDEYTFPYLDKKDG